MRLYDRIIIHNGHIVDRSDFEEWYGEKVRNEHTDGKYDDSFEYYTQTESKPTRNIKSFCVELMAISEKLETNEAYKVFGYAIRTADNNLQQEQYELSQALTVYLDVLKQGK